MRLFGKVEHSVGHGGWIRQGDEVWNEGGGVTVNYQAVRSTDWVWGDLDRVGCGRIRDQVGSWDEVTVSHQ